MHDIELLNKYCMENNIIFNFDDIKKYLNYEKEFWEFIKSKILFISDNIESNKYFYSVLRKEKDDILIDIKIIVPKIIDLKTTLINIHEFKHAYDLYKVFGKKVYISDTEYEKRAMNEEIKFIDNKILNKVRRF